MPDSKLTALEHLKMLAQRAKAEEDALNTKIAAIKVPTQVSQLTNDAGYQTGSDVESKIAAKISSVYKPGGSYAFESLPEPDEGTLGMVYNVTDAFTPDERFLEGAGSKTYPAGTNVVVVLDQETYKFDILAGFVDLSGYQPKEAGKVLSTNDYTTAEKTKLGGIAEGATKVEQSGTNGSIKINGVDKTVYTLPEDVLHTADIATTEEVEAALNSVFGGE